MACSSFKNASHGRKFCNILTWVVSNARRFATENLTICTEIGRIESDYLFNVGFNKLFKIKTAVHRLGSRIYCGTSLRSLNCDVCHLGLLLCCSLIGLHLIFGLSMVTDLNLISSFIDDSFSRRI